MDSIVLLKKSYEAVAKWIYLQDRDSLFYPIAIHCGNNLFCNSLSKNFKKFLSFYYLSLAATTPGSSFPSRNSKEAPPPVEI